MNDRDGIPAFFSNLCILPFFPRLMAVSQYLKGVYSTPASYGRVLHFLTSHLVNYPYQLIETDPQKTN